MQAHSQERRAFEQLLFADYQVTANEGCLVDHHSLTVLSSKTATLNIYHYGALFDCYRDHSTGVDNFTVACARKVEARAAAALIHGNGFPVDALPAASAIFRRPLDASADNLPGGPRIEPAWIEPLLSAAQGSGYAPPFGCSPFGFCPYGVWDGATHVSTEAGRADVEFDHCALGPAATTPCPPGHCGYAGDVDPATCPQDSFLCANFTNAQGEPWRYIHVHSSARRERLACAAPIVQAAHGVLQDRVRRAWPRPESDRDRCTLTSDAADAVKATKRSSCDCEWTEQTPSPCGGISDGSSCWDTCCPAEKIRAAKCSCEWAEQTPNPCGGISDGSGCWDTCCPAEKIRAAKCSCEWAEQTPNPCGGISDGSGCWDTCCPAEKTAAAKSQGEPKPSFKAMIPRALSDVVPPLHRIDTTSALDSFDSCVCDWVSPGGCVLEADDGSYCWTECCMVRGRDGGGATISVAMGYAKAVESFRGGAKAGAGSHNHSSSGHGGSGHGVSGHPASGYVSSGTSASHVKTGHRPKRRLMEQLSRPADSAAANDETPVAVLFIDYNSSAWTGSRLSRSADQHDNIPGIQFPLSVRVRLAAVAASAHGSTLASTADVAIGWLREHVQLEGRSHRSRILVVPFRERHATELYMADMPAPLNHGFPSRSMQRQSRTEQNGVSLCVLAPPLSTFQAFESATHGKARTHQWLREHGFGQYALHEWSDPDDRSIVFPVVVKPQRGFAGKDVRIVQTRDELHAAVDSAAAHQQGGWRGVVIQEAVAGQHEWGVYFAATRGVVASTICIRFTFNEPLFVRHGGTGGAPSSKVMPCSECPFSPAAMSRLVHATSFHGFGCLGLKSRPVLETAAIFEMNTRMCGSIAYNPRLLSEQVRALAASLPDDACMV